MWVVLGAHSCHWVVFEKSAVLQLNELFWVIIIFLADAMPKIRAQSSLPHFGIIRKGPSIIDISLQNCNQTVNCYYPRDCDMRGWGSWQKYYTVLFTSFMDVLQDPSAPIFLGKTSFVCCHFENICVPIFLHFNGSAGVIMIGIFPLYNPCANSIFVLLTYKALLDWCWWNMTPCLKCDMCCLP